MSEETKEPTAVETAETVENTEPAPKAKKPRNKGKIAAVIVVIVVIVGVAGAAFWTWHETPGFCAAICHNMDEYLATYNEDQNTTGTDKWGNKVTNTNAMMATLHRVTPADAKSEMGCMDCHHAVIGEQVTEGMEQITGNYYDKLNERVGGDLTKWWGDTANEDTFCANANCHVYLLSEDGTVNRDKLEQTTSFQYGTYNPHSQHHETIELSCTECHKGHRASVLYCTACHTDGEFTLPDGWITYQENEKLINARFAAE